MPKSKTYDEFVEKFKPKKTTDDCYTPPSVYAVIRDWACNEYGIDPAKIVRPMRGPRDSGASGRESSGCSSTRPFDVVQRTECIGCCLF